MGESRSRAARPKPRATSLFARTVFRELRRAGYSRAEVLAFVGEMMDLVTTSEADDERLTSITDAETSAPNAEAVRDALEFELRRANERGSSLLLVVIEPTVADWVPDDVAQRFHADVARYLQRGAREHDTVGRLDEKRHIAVLAGPALDMADAIVRRWLGPLIAPRRSDDGKPEGISLRYGASSYDGVTSTMQTARDSERYAVDGGEALVERALVAPKIDLAGPPHDASTRTSDPAPRDTRDAREATEVVLALGGGAARAAAHIGALRALRQRGLRVVGIAGTSAGAIVGAMVLSGMSDDQILERFTAFPRTATYRKMRRLYAGYRVRAQVPRSGVDYFRRSGLAFVSNVELAAIDDDTFTTFIEHFVGPDRDITTLERPFCASAIDLVAGRSVALSSGPLHAVLKATCALPGLFAPQRIEGRLMVDGSTTSDVPILAAIGLGQRARVIAVHLARPDQRVDSYSSSAEVVTRTSALVHTELVREQLRHAPELVIAPAQEVGWLDFRRAGGLVQVGFEAMESHLARVTPFTRAAGT